MFDIKSAFTMLIYTLFIHYVYLTVLISFVKPLVLPVTHAWKHKKGMIDSLDISDVSVHDDKVAVSFLCVDVETSEQ